ncbi:MAG TPA: SIR2 family protein [Candidatus Sulfotelmatobacter sp.]|nr:SIR2 family protein [Candidatus Sulfotelmatobacter sp.]
MTAGLPGLTGIKAAAIGLLTPQYRAFAERLDHSLNIEQVLTKLRRIAAIAEGAERVSQFTSQEARGLDVALCASIVASVAEPPGSIDAFRSLAIWAAGARYKLPIEVFTTNYDTLIERGLEEEGVSYFDGFVGTLKARFREDLVDVPDIDPESIPPAGFTRLWKLHGSINWQLESHNERRSVFRLGAPVQTGAAAAIYPSDEKYDDSRRVPFVVLMDRFRHGLALPESCTLICGYSFGDQHLNDVIYDAAKRFPRSEIIAACFHEIPVDLASRAEIYRNILVLSPNEAIIGGIRANWAADNVAAGIFEGGRFLLGDFRRLALFLTGSRLAPTSANA